MTIKEILRALVDSESADERMTIVEDNMALFEGESEGVDTTQLQTSLDEALAQIEESTKTIEELKLKYKDRFFNGEETEEDTEEPEKKTTTDDLVKEMENNG